MDTMKMIYFFVAGLSLGLAYEKGTAHLGPGIGWRPWLVMGVVALPVAIWL